MLNFQFVAKAKLLVLLCQLCLTGIVFGVFMPSYAQNKTRQNSSIRPEYAFSKMGGVFRVDLDGRLSTSDIDAKGQYYYSVTNLYLLRVNPDASMIYVGGQQYQPPDGQEKSFVKVYQLLPHAKIQMRGTIAHGTSNSHPYALAFGSKGRFLYLLTVHKSVGGQFFSYLSTFRCDKNGLAIDLIGTEQQVGAASLDQTDIQSDPSGHFVYITQPNDHTIKQYRVSASGLLKPLFPATVSLPQTPSTLIFPKGTSFLYVVSAKDNSLTQLRMKPNGCLQASHFFRFGSAKRTTDPILAISPDGRFLYVADDTLPVTRQYAVKTNGAIQPLSPPTMAFSPNYIAVDLTSRFAYLVDNGVTNQQLIHPFCIGPTGSLVQIKGNPASDVYPVSLTFAQPR